MDNFLKSCRSHKSVFGYCLIVGLAATAFGFDQGETSGFLAMEQFNKDFGTFDEKTQTWALTAGAQTCLYGIELGTVFLASAVSGWIGSRYGRKIGLVLCAVTGLIGSGIQMISHYVAAVVGRAFMGLSIGFAGNFTITYWSEVTPVELRGFIVIFYQFFINLPNFLGSCVNQATYRFDNPWAYRAPLLTTFAAPLLLLALIWLVPESPRWLVTRNRVDEARQSIRKIRGSSASQEELDREIDEVLAFTALEESLESSATYSDCFKGTDLRRTLITVLVMVGQQLTGIAFISGYLTYFFSLVGLTDAFLVTVIANLCQIGGVLFAFAIVRWVGRRTILITGIGVCSFCMLAFSTISLVTKGEAASKCLISFICIFCFTYAGTWGSIGPVVLGEVPSNRLRSKTVSLALSSSWIFCLAIITGIPYLLSPSYANLGTKVGFVFGGLSLCVFVATVIAVPETKNRSLEEIDEMFINRVSVSRFKTYQVVGRAAAEAMLDLKTLDSTAMR